MTSPTEKTKNNYKIGVHTGDKNKLINRYSTYLRNVIVEYFRNDVNAIEHEKIVKQKLFKNRLPNNNGNATEWVHINLGNLKKIIDNVINNDHVNNNFKKFPQTNNFKKFPQNNNFKKFPQKNNIPKKIPTNNNKFSQNDKKFPLKNNFNKFPYKNETLISNNKFTQNKTLNIGINNFNKFPF